MAMARLQEEKITTTPKQLEAFQLELIDNEAVSRNRLDKIAKDIAPTVENHDQTDQSEHTKKQTNKIDPDSLARLLFSVLRRRSLSRSIIFSVFTSMFIEAKARDKQALPQPCLCSHTKGQSRSAVAAAAGLPGAEKERVARNG